MIEIIPAIIAKNFQELQEKIKLVEPYTKWAQIDIMDGKFTPPTTWNNPSELSKIKTKLNLEAHLMISEPEKTIDDWLASPVKRILLHYESWEKSKIKIQKLIKKIQSARKEAGLVLKLTTPISVLDNLFRVSGFKLQVVQLMGIAKIGYYGHGFDNRVLGKIKSLRKKYPKMPVEIDGGINPENAKKAIKAGANRLAVGSYIFKSRDIKKSLLLLAFR